MWWATAALLSACATPAPPDAPRVLVFGEQHDQPDHQRQVAGEVTRLAAAGRLAAVVIEMADRGRSTAGLPPDSTEAQVREALGWSGWPWDDYAPVVMAAVRAAVPVLGGNLPRGEMRSAMSDASLDAAIDDAARARLADAVRTGHCGLLPAEREPGMVRIQIARDRSMARTVDEALARAPGSQAVLLLTGAQHAARDRGVPLHLSPAASGRALRVVVFGDAPPDLAADERRPAAVAPRDDPCAALRERLPAAAPRSSAP